MSNTTLYSELLPDVLPDVPGAPEGLVLRRIRDTFIEFTRETQVWQQELDPIKIREGVIDYEFDGDQLACADIDAVRLVERYKDQAQLDTHIPELRMIPFADFVITEIKWAIRLPFTPSTSLAGRLIVILVALRPKLDAIEIDERFFIDWYEFISHGAKFKLMSIPNKGYTDVAGASFHEMEYQRGIAKARMEVYKGRTNGNLQVSTMRRFTLGGAASTLNLRDPDRFFLT